MAGRYGKSVEPKKPTKVTAMAVINELKKLKPAFAELWADAPMRYDLKRDAARYAEEATRTGKDAKHAAQRYWDEEVSEWG